MTDRQVTEPVTELRGFDSYEVRLGDDLRGCRASLGKSLLDVQRDLRIKASYIDAIENCDASVFPNRGFVAGYVRAYARYLLLDPSDIYQRFCDESGFAGLAGSPAQDRPRDRPRDRVPAAGERRVGAALAALPGMLRRGIGMGAAPAYDPALARNHFSAPLGSARRIGIGVSMSGIASVAVLAALVAGLGYGGWYLLQDIQRVGFAPSPDAPRSGETPADVALPDFTIQAFASTGHGAGGKSGDRSGARPDQAPDRLASADDARRDAALEELYAPRDLSAPDIALRDGPIAAINPESSGLFAPPPARVAAGSGQPDDAAPVAAADSGAAEAGPTLLASAPAPAPAAAPAPRGVWVLAAEPAWIRVRAGDGSTLVQRIFKPGDRFEIPDGVTGARLRAGNAGGVYIQVDGEIRGPLGVSGGVVKKISLDPARLRDAYALAEILAPQPATPAPRTEARLKLDD